MRDHDPAKEGRQKGPQDHAEGQHGSKTHSRFLEQLHENLPEGTSDDSADGGTKRRSERPARDAED
jgi:hypothetical protein